MNRHNNKLPIMSLMATVSMLGGRVEVVEEKDGFYRVSLLGIYEHPIRMRCKRGDDEQLRAILQSLLRSISGAVGPLDVFSGR